MESTQYAEDETGFRKKIEDLLKKYYYYALCEQLMIQKYMQIIMKCPSNALYTDFNLPQSVGMKLSCEGAREDHRGEMKGSVLRLVNISLQGERSADCDLMGIPEGTSVSLHVRARVYVCVYE